MMLGGMVFHDLDLSPGSCIKIGGDIPSDAKHFSINLGKDDLNLALHLNPRFNAFKDKNLLVCNCRNDGVWNPEQRESHFPLVPASRTEITIIFEKTYFVVKLDDGYQFNYNNYLNFKTINFLSVSGDFKVKAVTFDCPSH
ncbi:galectin-1-like isoform X2 [Sminthopsis crassicaudata]|uniref:galectin-1-like isoform X2 n=1 Tax=Sminthopsis crassicaudata TaxID=9301 RepID=UPI003D683A44